MGSMRTVSALAALLLVSACAGGIQAPPHVAGNVRLYEATANQIAVIDATTHAVVARLPLGVPSSDWQHLYSITGSTLIDTNPSTGATNRTVDLPGLYKLPAATSTGLPGGTSPNGIWLVVESYDGSATHFLIVSTAESRVSSSVNLAGYFHFDAISNDGKRLYLIQYLNGKEYYVRLYDIAARKLDANIVVDKSDGGQSMTGLRLSGAATPDGSWLFSMYVRDSDGPFIHALSLDGPFAFCLDLPGSGYATKPGEKHWSIAMSPRGDKFFAVNSATGVVAEIDNSQPYNPQVTRTARITGGQPTPIGSNASVLTGDGSSIVTAGSSGLLWIDTRTLEVRMRLLPDWHIWSIGLAPDGKSLYAVGDSGAIAEVSVFAARVTATFDPGVGQPLALLRVASA